MTPFSLVADGNAVREAITPSRHHPKSDAVFFFPNGVPLVNCTGLLFIVRAKRVRRHDSIRLIRTEPRIPLRTGDDSLHRSIDRCARCETNNDNVDDNESTLVAVAFCCR